MASAKSARRSRKRRAAGKAPRSVPSDRRARRTDVPAPAAAGRSRYERSAGSTYGERPPGRFGAVPVSEIAILCGAIATISGWVTGAPIVLFTGLGFCYLGVLEVTSREHFSGYRSHTTLLAGMITVLAETVIALLLHPHQRALLVIPLVPVFGLSFRGFQRRFTAARQERVRALPQA